MVDLVRQFLEVREKPFSSESLKTMVIWGAEEVERLRKIIDERDAEIHRLHAMLSLTQRRPITET